MTDEQQAEMNAVVGQYNRTNTRQISVFFDEGDDTPYRISDEYSSESFASYEELLEAAKSWNDTSDQQS